MTKQNFLLGKGERLTEDIVVRAGGGPKVPPYSFGEARTRLVPRLSKAVEEINDLPKEACPKDLAVLSLTLNPEYIAKSYYPDELLRTTGFTPVGSRPRKIIPEKRSRNREPVETTTTELFVVASRESIRGWANALPGWNSNRTEVASNQLVTIEDISAPTPAQKIKGAIPTDDHSTFEIVLHTDELLGENYFLHDFREYLNGFGLKTDFTKRFYAGGLCFVELDAPASLTDEIATFSIVRAVREMPRLRMLRPTIRSSAIPAQTLHLPLETALEPEINVAIFDGGLPDGHPLTAWATPIDTVNLGPANSDYMKHGIGVTSALLFGHIDPKKPLERPYTNIDHYRVLDSNPGQNPHELYEVLDRIDKVLAEKDYQFVNLSLGPRLPIEDDDVHAWTAVLDDRFSGENILAAIAVGNDGEGDSILGLNRVQVPADCVNALAVGACDTPDDNWNRAPYSSVGPGRSPGLIKPDLVEFGGSMERPFIVVGEGDEPSLDSTGGTSFAAPSVLRLGTGIRAHFGTELSSLAIRTLLIHKTEENGHPHQEVGWGRVARSLEEIVTCEDDTIRVVYQGSISPAKYVRAPIPLPSEYLTGNVTITASICYKSLTDPHHPSNYTRAGLEVAFRPNDQKFSRDTQIHPDTKSFFGAVNLGMTEDELRRDAWKWENCLHANRRFRGTSLRNPCFDIHYNSRLESRNFSSGQPLRYALVVSVHAKNIADLYDQVVRKYSTQLEPLRPTVEIPIET